MEIRMTKHLYREGIFRSALIVPDPIENGRWNLIFERNSGKILPLTKARTDIKKTYKKINSAIADARDIGFRRIHIEFDSM